MAKGEKNGPGIVDLKVLFSRSGNSCAFPNCPEKLIEGGTVLGEICHIHGSKPGSARYDQAQTAEQRHSHENLILLCQKHHKIIDDDEATYTAEKVFKMKSDHENRAADIPADEVDRCVVLLDQSNSVTTVNQTGGIAAGVIHTVNNYHAPAAAAASPEEELRQFHENRVREIEAGKVPVGLIDASCIVMHVLPFSAVDSKPHPSFSEILKNSHRFVPMKSAIGRDTKTSVDGVLIGSNANGLGEPQRAYINILRSGITESVWSSIGKGHNSNFLSLPDIERTLIQSARGYSVNLSALGINAPMVIAVSLIGCIGKRLMQVDLPGGALHVDIPAGIVDRSPLNFDCVTFYSPPTDLQHCARLMRPLLNHLANAAGMPSCANFDANGNYVPQMQ